MSTATNRICQVACMLGGLPLVACLGNVDDNAPGQDTYLPGGALAVDHRTEVTFTLQNLEDTDEETCEVITSQFLYAIDPETARATLVEDLSGLYDLRILFPKDSILMMEEHSTGTEEDAVRSDHLVKRDMTTFEEVDRVETEARYHGTRMSASRRYVGVGDNNDPALPVHVIDTKDLSAHVMQHSGNDLEAMWLHQSDRLLAISFSTEEELLDDGSTHYSYDAQILSWTLPSDAEAGPEQISSALSVPDSTIPLPNVAMDYYFSYTWIGVSPDDRYAAFPVIEVLEETGDYQYTLKILNLSDGSVRDFPHARGPVGFTPDGSSLVSYIEEVLPQEDGTTTSTWSLLIIDPETLEYEQVELPGNDGPSYFVTREGNFVVADALSANQLWLYDIDQQELTQVDAPEVALYEFVSRLGENELWMVSSQSLYRLDFVDGALEELELDWTPSHINILPQRDLLVLDDQASSRVMFYDPKTREVVREAQLLHELEAPEYLGM